MPRPLLRLAAALAGGLVSAPAVAQDAKAVAEAARAALKTHCYRCHHGPGSDGGDFDVLKPVTMTAAREGGEKPYVVAGKPASSLLFQRMAVRKQGAGDMPPADIAERPAAADKAAVKAWIEAGAPDVTPPQGRAYVSAADVLTAVRDDLRAADKEDRPYLRYFTLANLHNNPKVPDVDVRLLRAALSKAVNSLSWKPGVVLPRAVGTAQVVYAVDVRKLDWDRHDRWRAVMRAYPYGLRYAGSPDPTLVKLDGDVTELTGCELPLVRADWFVATATRPPLYHELLNLPTHAGDLEKQLDVDVPANFGRDELMRAGFAGSGVSGQNRLVERHDARYGAYWKSYDFKAGNARESLPRFPLGPVFHGTQYADHAFAHDGGEIIFHLPNGLQGYLLVDGKDNRIDVGPIAVVGDSLKTSGTSEIVTGVSCMACHKHGMLPVPPDQIRAGTGVLGDARRKVQRLYPEAAVLNEKVRRDSDRFVRALDEAVGPYLKVGDDAKKDIREFPEPAGEAARAYRLQDVDLTVAACELDVAKPDDLKAMVSANKKLREYGLGALALPGGAVKRADWERVGATSLMQRAAREIEKGTPYNVAK